jgi:hypothetical protein
MPLAIAALDGYLLSMGGAVVAAGPSRSRFPVVLEPKSQVHGQGSKVDSGRVLEAPRRLHRYTCATRFSSRRRCVEEHLDEAVASSARSLLWRAVATLRCLLRVMQYVRGGRSSAGYRYYKPSNGTQQRHGRPRVIMRRGAHLLWNASSDYKTFL